MNLIIPGLMMLLIYAFVGNQLFEFMERQSPTPPPKYGEIFVICLWPLILLFIAGTAIGNYLRMKL